MNAELDHFMEQVLGVVRGAGTHGVVTSAPNIDGTRSDIGYQLQTAALTFAQLYSNPATTKDQLERQAKEVEGYLETLQVLTSHNQKTDELIDEMYNLIEKRK